MCRGKRGFTLLEVLVVAFLSVLGMVILVSVLVPTFRVAARGNQSVELQQMGAVAVQKLMADLDRTPVTGLVLPDQDSPRPSLALHRLSGVTAQGERQWDDRLVLYVWERQSGRLLRKEWPPEPPALSIAIDPSRPLQPSGQEVDRIAGSSNSTERPLALHVTSFELSSSSASELTLPLVLKLVLEQPLGGGESASLELTRKIYLRNES
ncbi:MAG: type II secretion system protein [Armatimonadetes bacterium]|nr:type II secretion system protein [Armatimonadota bacterium]